MCFGLFSEGLHFTHYTHGVSPSEDEIVRIIFILTASLAVLKIY